MEKLPECFPKLLCHFTFPLAKHVGSDFSIFIPTLIIVCIYNYSHPGAYELTSHLVLICSFLMTVMMSIFSCAYWPFVYPLWKTIYSDPLPMYLSHYWVLSVICFKYESLTRYMTCKYFLPFSGLHFHFLASVLWSTKGLNFDEVLFICLLLLLLIILVSYLGIHGKIQGHVDSPLCFF